MILLALARYRLPLEILAALALLAGAAGGIHAFLEHERELGRNEMRAAYAAQLQAAQAAARQRETELTTQRDKAIDDAHQRDQTIAELNRRAGTAADGLRGTIAAVGRSLPGLAADALRDTAGTYGELLAECAARRIELAGEAEKLNSEKRTLIEAWPGEVASRPPAP